MHESSNSVRAKFRVNSYETTLNHGDNEEMRTIKLSAVMSGSDENKRFFKWTPNGTISIGILNRSAWEKFPLGAEVFVDFTVAEPEKKEVAA